MVEDGIVAFETNMERESGLGLGFAECRWEQESRWDGDVDGSVKCSTLLITCTGDVFTLDGYFLVQEKMRMAHTKGALLAYTYTSKKDTSPMNKRPDCLKDGE